MRVQRGHRRRTKGAHQAVTDARVDSMVKVGERHGIDRGDKRIVRNSKKGGGGRRVGERKR